MKLREAGEAELVMGVLLIIPRPAPFIARTSDLEIIIIIIIIIITLQHTEMTE